MRISSGIVAAFLIAVAGAAAAQQPATDAPASYLSAQAALDRGLNAYQAGRPETAIAALNAAVATGDPSARFVAEYYLARLYSENAGAAVDHAKAFVLFRKLADENVNVDPGTSKRAPFVAKALIALAGYMRAGIPEIDLAPSPRRAADYLHHAAVFFGDKDAQLELARIYLSGDPQKEERSDDVRRGLHHLSVLTEESYAPAQAVLADLFWRGRFVRRDDRRALALASLAVENAPAHERIWIEASYAAIFCAATPALRAEAGDLAARWHKAMGQPAPSARPGLASLAGLAGPEFLPERQCADGEKVAIVPPARSDVAAALPSGGLAPLKTTPPPTSFRAAGILEAAAKK
jgi:TPR repeat protein